MWYSLYRHICLLKALFPLIKATPVHAHDSAQFLDWGLCRQFHYDFVFLLFKEKYSLFTPSPFTSYPFFARASLKPRET